MTSFNQPHRNFDCSTVNCTLLILTLTAFQLLARDSMALPTVLFLGQQTDRYGPNSVPFTPVGDKVQVLAALDSVDPIGSPTISVTAVQGDTTITLEPIPPDNPLFPGLHGYRNFIDLDPGLTGSWTVIPADSSGIGPSSFTNTILDPEFLPLVTGIKLQSTPLSARVSWTNPSLDGFDADAITVRAIEANSGLHVWQSDLLPIQTTSFAPPAGTLQLGVEYVYWINIVDFMSGSIVENSSKTFTQAFRLTVAGDYNQNGVVDAADYTVWHDNLGSESLMNRDARLSGPVGDADYDVWRANFGQALGAGSGAAPTVPEPATCLLCVLALGHCPSRWRYRSDFSGRSSIRRARLLNSVSPG
ncbi:MAG: hypothetical protein AB7G28_06055 [Pirellulales bacterium]